MKFIKKMSVGGWDCQPVAMGREQIFMHTATSKREIRHLIPQKTTVRLSDPGIVNGSLFLFQIKTGIF